MGGGPCPFFSWNYLPWSLILYTHTLVNLALGWRDDSVIVWCTSGLFVKGIDRLIRRTSALYVNNTFSWRMQTISMCIVLLYTAQTLLFLYTLPICCIVLVLLWWSVTRKHGLNHRTMLFLAYRCFGRHNNSTTTIHITTTKCFILICNPGLDPNASSLFQLHNSLDVHSYRMQHLSWQIATTTTIPIFSSSPYDATKDRLYTWKTLLRGE